MTRHPTRMVNSENSDLWSPWPVKDMRSLMYFNITCSSIAGLFPFKYNSQTYLFSKTRFAVSTITTFAYVAFVVYEAHSAYSMNVFLSRLKYVSMILQFLAVAILIFTTYATTHKRLNVLQKMLKITRILTRQDFNDLAKFIHTKDIIVILYYTTFVVYCAIEWSIFPLLRIGSTYVGGVSIVGEMFYVNCVRVLGACFKKVNERLKQLNNPLMNYRPEFLRTDSLLYGQNTLLLMHVKHCEELHQEVGDTVEVLNDAFRETIIIFTISTFCTITTNLYFVMQWMSKHNIRGVSDFADRFMSFLFAMYSGLKFILSIYVCETATNEAKEITTTVHQVAADCTDSTVRREVIGNYNYSVDLCANSSSRKHIIVLII
ncbi:uncharacterized protein LOC143211474 [Lasioglossum baleicum]|uniref:uncharacterized protein LOC143211474 n=1 Tax=Lasioglossum baleicum TaxID=434251 RepID=UPI003FCEA6AE